MVDLTMTDELTRRSSDHIMHERIKAVEVKQDIIHGDLKDLKDEVQGYRTLEDHAHSSLEKKLAQIQSKMDKQAGYFAGIATAISVIVAGIGMALKWFQQ